jgi:cytochrome c553
MVLYVPVSKRKAKSRKNRTMTMYQDRLYAQKLRNLAGMLSTSTTKACQAVGTSVFLVLLVGGSRG